MEASLAAAAVKNPIFRESLSKAAFAAISKGDEEDEENTWSKDPKNNSNTESSEKANGQPSNELGVSQKELDDIKKWANLLKYAMILISLLMTFTAFYNFVGGSTVASAFVALYILFFSVLVCCFECALKSFSIFIVQNFGFMYNPFARMIFILFVAFLNFELSIVGKVVFALLLLEACVQIYVYVKHPKFVSYMQKLHYYNKVKSGSNVEKV